MRNAIHSVTSLMHYTWQLPPFVTQASEVQPPSALHRSVIFIFCLLLAKAFVVHLTDLIDCLWCVDSGMWSKF